MKKYRVKHDIEILIHSENLGVYIARRGDVIESPDMYLRRYTTDGVEFLIPIDGRFEEIAEHRPTKPEELKGKGGWYLNAQGFIVRDENNCPWRSRSDLSPTQELEETKAARSRLLQYMWEWMDGKLPVWDGYTAHYCIVPCFEDGHAKLKVARRSIIKYFLAFHTEEIAKAFLAAHRGLIMKALPIL